MRASRVLAGVACVMVLAGIAAAPAQALEGVPEQCTFSDKRFTEISGMTYSQLHPGVIYVHNDSSGGPRIYAVDSRTCKTLATLTLSGAEARDFEAIGSGRDRKGRPILWVGDIGDNLDSWSDVRLLRVREPLVLKDATVKVKTYRFTYPQGPQNAEALLTDPSSMRVWVVTKKLAKGRLYELSNLRKNRVTKARLIQPEEGLITDGSVSPDGTRYVLRDYVDAVVYSGLPAGRKLGTVYLPFQLQGEAVTWTGDGKALLIASERDRRLLRVELNIRPV